jgi:predicted ribosome quality control (RQC) complex YloA/Tae2 family protein
MSLNDININFLILSLRVKDALAFRDKFIIRGYTMIEEIVLKSGSTIRIGKNSRDNEILTHVEAGMNDLWFHVEDYSGGHIVLHNDNGMYTKDDIQTAANIAAYHSKARSDKKVAVMYAVIKDVQKDKRCKMGEVIVNDYKTIIGRPSKPFRSV